jgi:hypothetical protein
MYVSHGALLPLPLTTTYTGRICSLEVMLRQPFAWSAKALLKHYIVFAPPQAPVRPQDTGSGRRLFRLKGLDQSVVALVQSQRRSGSLRRTRYPNANVRSPPLPDDLISVR